MSGGHFSYQQYRINDIVDSIEQEVIKSGKPIPEKAWDYYDRQYYKEHPEEAVNYDYPEPILRRFEEAVYALKKAAIYAQRVDWLLSGDDGEESFEKRLREELAELESQSKTGDNGEKYFVIDRTQNPYADDD